MPFFRDYSRYGMKTHIYESVGSFLNSDVNTGIHTIIGSSNLLDLEIVNNNQPTTIVLFHAAADPSAVSLPLFVGKHLTEDTKANLVFVSDPCLDHGVAIGWYAGHQQMALQTDLTRIFHHIHSAIPNSKNLVFFGMSAGGYAALTYSHAFKSSLAVVCNPQTNISRYHQNKVEDYSNKCWGGMAIPEIPAITNVVDLYENNFPNYVIYLQNADDDFHIGNHMTPWLRATSINASRRAIMIEEWGNGHFPPPPLLIRSILEYGTEVNGEWSSILDDDLFT